MNLNEVIPFAFPEARLGPGGVLLQDDGDGRGARIVEWPEELGEQPTKEQWQQWAESQEFADWRDSRRAAKAKVKKLIAEMPAEKIVEAFAEFILLYDHAIKSGTTPAAAYAVLPQAKKDRWQQLVSKAKTVDGL